MEQIDTPHSQAGNGNSRLRSIARMAMALAALLLFLPAMHAQTTATIFGTVNDKSGGSLAGAKVTLTGEATGQARETVSNKDGYFAFPAILPGSYSVKIEANGYKTLQQQAITVNAADQRNLADIVLEVGQAQETVTVQENVQIVPVDSGQRAAVLDSKDIQQLALVSRNLTELLKVLPGVTSAPAGLGAGASFNALTVSNAQSAVGNGLNANGAPNRGGTSQLSDGVDIDDPGCDCNSIALLNPDFTQEVSIQTSNFGADAPRGPVVINTISKSGGDKYHGEAYLYARNDILNANDWVSKHQGKARGAAHYYYPGGNVGGPIPFTQDKLRFWFGYERFLQNTGNTNFLQAHVPTVDMQAGNFTNTAANVAFCQGVLTPTSTTGCNDLTGAILPDGTPVVGSIIPAKFLDPGAKSLSSFWPKPNADPNANGGHYNYFQIIPGTHNGYVFRTRVDYNLDDKNSFYISYQYGQDSAPLQGNGAHIYWTPGNSIPYPGGGLVSNSYSKAIAGHFVHVFSPTLTNEFIASWGYGNFPAGPPNAKAANRSTLNYPANYGTVFNTGSPIIPSYSSPGDFTFPDFSQQDIFENGGLYLVRKETPAFADNVTKVFGTHLLKFGGYMQNVSNLQGSFESPNGNFNNFGFGGTLTPNAITGARIGAPNNPTANFLMGIATGYSENDKSPNSDMAYQDFSFYGDDSWKATKQLTIQYGVRFDHIGHWYDRQGTGMAVFLPATVATDKAAGKLNPGLQWHGINPGIPKSGMPDRFALVSPRFGIAYDLFGTGKSVLRGGWGSYRFAEQYNNFNGALTTAQGIQGYNLQGNSSIQFSQIGLLPKPTPGKGVNGTVYAEDPNNYAIPVTHSYNFTVSQQLPLNSLVELAYVGSDTSQITLTGQTISGGGFSDFGNQNKVPLGAFFKADPVTGLVAANPENLSATGNNQSADYRPFGAAYGDNAINVSTSVGYGNYNSFQATWLKRSDRLTYNLNYTWSKTLGTGLNIDPFTVHGNYGIASIDRPHVINTSYAYNFLQAYHGDSKLVAGAANGWTISGITTWQAGGNLQAINNPNFGMSLQYTTVNGAPIQNDATKANYNPLPAGVGTGIGPATYYGTNAAISIQPNVTCDPSGSLASNQTVRANCFAAPAFGQKGLRNFQYLHGPAYFDSDLALYKTFHIVENHTIQFRMNASNWLNHPLPQFSGNNNLKLSYGADYNTKAYTPIIGPGQTQTTFGQFDTKAGSPSQRILELALKYQF